MERLLRNLYGSTPQIDLDRQIARVRVVRPMTLDFAALADGLKRNNVGYGGADVTAEVEAVDDRLRFTATGQAFPRAGPGPETPGSSRRTVRVLDGKDPSKTRLELLR
ncbi:MAG TPA: hypothetical protein VEJ18_18125 [Planctomycetota bacterium]|nr:hypothetical protein [Planctomycetota bacterium]